MLGGFNGLSHINISSAVTAVWCFTIFGVIFDEKSENVEADLSLTSLTSAFFCQISFITPERFFLEIYTAQFTTHNTIVIHEQLAAMTGERRLAVNS